MFRKSERGFTLIELLVVIAILGVLSGIAVPRVLVSLEDARTRAEQTNVAILQTAIERLAIDQSLTTLSAWNTALGTPVLVIGTPRAITGHTAAFAPYVSRIPIPRTGRQFYITLSEVGTPPVVVATITANADPHP